MGKREPRRAGSGEGLRSASGASGTFATADGWIALAVDEQALPGLREAIGAVPEDETQAVGLAELPFSIPVEIECELTIR